MKSILFDQHVALGAQLIDFGGWHMPLQYKGIREEHEAVRTRAALFDVSHMGRIGIQGEDAEKFLDFLAANKIADKKALTATYTVLCNEQGGSLEDTIIYRIDNRHFFMVANAANRQKDLLYLQRQAKDYAVTIVPYFDKEGILSLQGPIAQQILLALFSEGSQLIKPMQLMETYYQGLPLFLATTGYTGAGGYEIYAPYEILFSLWESILKQGAPHGLLPAGLGARNTLRLEMGYALYGHEIDETIAPTESVAAWSVKLDKENFCGREALLALANSPHKRFSCGLTLLEPGVMRDGYAIFRKGQKIGLVTSGSYSPTLKRSIALALTSEHLGQGEQVDIQIRQNFSKAEVSSVPFITRK